MIRPYTAVGLIPTVRGIRRREDIKTNLEHLAHLFKAASWLSSLDLPVRLIAIPEGALQAFNDEVLDLDHIEFARTCAIDRPYASSRAGSTRCGAPTPETCTCRPGCSRTRTPAAPAWSRWMCERRRCLMSVSATPRSRSPSFSRSTAVDGPQSKSAGPSSVSSR